MPQCPRTIRGTRAVIGTGATSTPTTGGGDLDPRFFTCTDAKAHGYSPYDQGRDAEYDWYIDGDSDGSVCE